MIIISKLLAIFLAALVISKVYYDFNKKKETLFTFLFWTLAWLVIVYVTFFPSILVEMSKDVGSEAGTGTFLGMALVLVFFVVYRVYVKANRLEQKLKNIVQKLGLKEIKKESKK